MAVRIVTDSTSDLPAHVARELGITVVPLNVRFGDDTYLDGVEISSDEFFERLAQSEGLPTTSQPSPGVFTETYRSLLDEGHEIVSIHISSKLSGTLNSASQAKESLGDVPIEVIDSKQATAALALVAIGAASAVKDGASFREAVETAQAAVDRVQLFAVFETLEYLKKGGRIGRVRALVSSLLRMRPMITVEDGTVTSLGVARSRAQGIQHLVNRAEELAPLKKAVVAHATSSDEAEEAAERIAPFLESGEVLRVRLGPVLGTYVGPGAWGIAVQSEKVGQPPFDEEGGDQS